MPPELSPETWVQIRHDYEHTEKPVEDICIEHGVSPGTLRDRMRRWRWTRRRVPIAAEGPPPTPAPRIVQTIQPLIPVARIDTTALPAAPPVETAACHIAAAEHAGTPEDIEPAAIVPRLQGAVARVLPAIEATLAKLGAEPTSPREMERAARALSSLTRTLRELNTLLSQHQAAAADDDMPEDMDAFRIDLARRINAFVDSRQAEATAKDSDGAQPEA